MPDYGLDLFGISDLSPSLTVVKGRAGLLQALARRLTTPTGSLWYAPTYGFDVRRLLNAPIVNAASANARIRAECLKDDRVDEANVRVVRVGRSLHVGIQVTHGAGPFDFVLDVNAVNVSVLRQSV
jgi:phage baseplate assembly protein W